MEIKSGFYLFGFTRIDKGESGAVFVHYEADTSKCPYGRKLTACAIVTRTSKNSYTAACYNEQRIATIKGNTLEELRKATAEFFEGETA